MSRLVYKPDLVNLSHDNNEVELKPRNSHTFNLSNYRDVVGISSPLKTDTSRGEPRKSKIIELEPTRKNTKKNVFGKKNQLKLEDFKYIPLNNKRIEILPETDGPYQTYIRNSQSKPIRNGKRVFNPLLTPSTSRTANSRTTENTLTYTNSQSDLGEELENPEESNQNEFMAKSQSVVQLHVDDSIKLEEDFSKTNPPPQNRPKIIKKSVVGGTTEEIENESSERYPSNEEANALKSSLPHQSRNKKRQSSKAMESGVEVNYVDLPDNGPSRMEFDMFKTNPPPQSRVTLGQEPKEVIEGTENYIDIPDDGPARADDRFGTNPPPQSRVELAPESTNLELQNRSTVGVLNKAQIYDNLMEEIEKQDCIMSKGSVPQKPAPKKKQPKKTFNMEECRKICNEYVEPAPKMDFPKEEPKGICSNCLIF